MNVNFTIKSDSPSGVRVLVDGEIHQEFSHDQCMQGVEVLIPEEMYHQGMKVLVEDDSKLLDITEQCTEVLLSKKPVVKMTGQFKISSDMDDDDANSSNDESCGSTHIFR